METKAALLKACSNHVSSRLKTVEDIILSHRKALSSETKSSAGDKHETGRAMLQLEMEKASQQLSSIQEMKETLAKINLQKTTALASLGSLVETNAGTYFLSVSVGQITLENQQFFAISVSSPIGKLLLGKKEGESLVWNGNKIQIHQIS